MDIKDSLVLLKITYHLYNFVLKSASKYKLVLTLSNVFFIQCFLVYVSEPGYVATPICMVQCVYTLLKEAEKLPKG